MKVSRRENMKRALKKGIRKAANLRAPGDGSMISLLYGDLDKNGGHYQVEFVHDTRFHEEPWVAAYWWPKGQRFVGVTPYCLTKYDLTKEK